MRGSYVAFPCRPMETIRSSRRSATSSTRVVRAAFSPIVGQMIFSQRLLCSSSQGSLSSHAGLQKVTPKTRLGYIPWRRYASTTSSKSKPKRASSAPSPSPYSLLTPSSVPAKSLAGDVNPPPSTRPAALDLPDPVSPSASLSEKALRYFKVGRAYVNFYKTGLKNVYHNYKASIPIRQRIGLPMYLPTSPVTRSLMDNIAVTNTTINLVSQSPASISRADFQLVRRAAHDVGRMIPFTILLIICGEFTPLVVLALGNAVTPFTCRVPGQIDKERRWRLETKRSAFGAIQASLGSINPVPVGSEVEMQWLADNFADPEFVNEASADQVLRGCALFGLTKSIDRPRWLVPILYRPRLKRWVEYLRIDDELIVKSARSGIARGGGVEGLSAEEVGKAVEERGGVGVGVEPSKGEVARQGWDVEREERRWLERWLRRRSHLFTTTNGSTLYA